MMRSLRWTLSLCLCLLTFPSLAPAQDVRVMTFNIRIAAAKDGPDAWPLRRELLFQTIDQFDPDLLGTQEVQPSQADALREHLKGYEMVGLPREDGKTTGERSAVFFKSDRFEKVKEGTFWLSPTPDVPGSKGWDAMFPRVCSWAELRDRKASGRPIVFFNTHWDHKGVTARAESAKVMRAKVTEIAGDKPVIITGDFNAAHDSAPHKEMLAGGFVEAFAETHPQPTTQDFTFHGFTGKNAHAKRIDWILRSNAFQTKSAAIDRTNDHGRYPSDHFPVTAVLEWRAQNATPPTR
jgi:endonuclease/exonuclease/phosphatase family metal-dependent hydrolase